MASFKDYKEVTFNTTDTEEIYLDKRILSSILIPNDSDFNSKTFEVHCSFDGKTFAPLYDNEGTKFVIQSGANRFIPVFINDFTSAVHVKFIASGSLAGKIITVGFTDIMR